VDDTLDVQEHVHPIARPSRWQLALVRQGRDKGFCSNMTRVDTVSDAKANDDISTLGFEEAIQQLEQIVKRLESGSVALEESISIYERGEALKSRCDMLLKKAEARIEKISVGPDGQAVGVTPLDAEK
jgi:exodeoxyribonuclease VII small subunit